MRIGRRRPHRYAFDVTEEAERDPLLTDLARKARSAGAEADQLARVLLQRTDSPIAAIKAVRAVTGMDLGEAKWVVHRNLDPKVRESAEQLWDDLLDELM